MSSVISELMKPPGLIDNEKIQKEAQKIRLLTKYLGLVTSFTRKKIEQILSVEGNIDTLYSFITSERTRGLAHELLRLQIAALSPGTILPVLKKRKIWWRWITRRKPVQREAMEELKFLANADEIKSYDWLTEFFQESINQLEKTWVSTWKQRLDVIIVAWNKAHPQANIYKYAKPKKGSAWELWMKEYNIKSPADFQEVFSVTFPDWMQSKNRSRWTAKPKVEKPQKPQAAPQKIDKTATVAISYISRAEDISKDDVLKEYLQNAIDKLIRNSTPWQMRIGPIINEWNRLYPTKGIYNYYHGKPEWLWAGEKWKNAYWIYGINDFARVFRVDFSEYQNSAWSVWIAKPAPKAPPSQAASPTWRAWAKWNGYATARWTEEAWSSMSDKGASQVFGDAHHEAWLQAHQQQRNGTQHHLADDDETESEHDLDMDDDTSHGTRPQLRATNWSIWRKHTPWTIIVKPQEPIAPQLADLNREEKIAILQRARANIDALLKKALLEYSKWRTLPWLERDFTGLPRNLDGHTHLTAEYHIKQKTIIRIHWCNEAKENVIWNAFRSKWFVSIMEKYPGVTFAEDKFTFRSEWEVFVLVLPSTLALPKITEAVTTRTGFILNWSEKFKEAFLSSVDGYLRWYYMNNRERLAWKRSADYLSEHLWVQWWAPDAEGKIHATLSKDCSRAPARDILEALHDVPQVLSYLRAHGDETPLKIDMLPGEKKNISFNYPGWHNSTSITFRPYVQNH